MIVPNSQTRNIWKIECRKLLRELMVNVCVWSHLLNTAIYWIPPSIEYCHLLNTTIHWRRPPIQDPHCRRTGRQGPPAAWPARPAAVGRSHKAIQVSHKKGSEKKTFGREASTCQASRWSPKVVQGSHERGQEDPSDGVPWPEGFFGVPCCLYGDTIKWSLWVCQASRCSPKSVRVSYKRRQNTNL